MNKENNTTEEIIIINNFPTKETEQEKIKKLIQEYEDDFEYQIKQRGIDYYHHNHVHNLIKTNDSFKATVIGNEIYQVKIEYDLDDEWIDYYCNCPYEYPCKHIYATMLAIKDNKYQTLNLKPIIPKQELTLSELLDQIPASELKTYILSEQGNKTFTINYDKLSQDFIKYMPSQSYEYYYNEIYNNFLTNNYHPFSLKEYLDKIQKLVLNQKYEEAFYICRAIIEVSHDTETLNNSELLEIFPHLGMNLRVIFRKADDNLEQIISEWFVNLIKNNFYQNLYLEDIILTITNIN